MIPQGYYRFPTIHGDTVLFVADDDLWRVSAGGGRAERLTAGLGPVSRPRLAPDGAQVAFTGAEEGVADVYVMPADGGPSRRLTWHGDAQVVGWAPDGRIVFASAEGRPHRRDVHLWAVAAASEVPPVRLPLGTALGVAFGPAGQTAVCRHQDDLASWQRYRGGRAGHIWLDGADDQGFRALDLPGNVASPLWWGERLTFLSDHGHDANLWSVAADGSDLQQHTRHEGHAVRWPDTDGTRIVYAVGGELWLLQRDVEPRPIEVAFHSPRTQLQRRFVPTPKYLQDHDLHPDGHTLGAVVRGQPVVLGAWEGPVRRITASTWDDGGRAVGVRHRLLRWLHDAERIVLVADRGGEEAFEVHRVEPDPRAVHRQEPRHDVLGELSAADAPVAGVRRFDGLDHGRPIEVEVDPTRARLALTNHRHELLLLDLQDGSLTPLDRSESGRIGAPAWSPDGRWIAWSRPEGPAGEGARIRLYDTEAGVTHDATDGRYHDAAPSFDPDGRYLYFLSHREFEPVYDNIYFDLGFPKGMRPYLLTLRRDLPDPFVPQPRSLRKVSPPQEPSRSPVRIDIEGLSERLVPFPVLEARYSRVEGLPGGRVLLSRSPVKSGLSRRWYDPGPPAADDALMLWDPDKRELTQVTPRITSFRLDRARQTVVAQVGWRLRIFQAAPDKGQREELRRSEGARPSRRSGWVDLARISVEVEPRAEWRQVTREAWRLMRDHFWTEDMSGTDWDEVYARYAPLVDRIGSRRELTDVLSAMQGELGTSHAYVMGGDVRSAPHYRIGRLGADLSWDEAREAWVVARVIRGEPGDAKRSSPLARPGVDVVEGDAVLAIDGLPLPAWPPPAAHLVNRADAVVELTVARGDEIRRVAVRTLSDEQPLRYRDWVLRNREVVHAATAGRAGYVHIPDMGPNGYAEFHRDYLAEARHDALVVDVRYNGGGHVSQLVLARLARRQVGYTVSRWGRPRPYPAHTVPGPMVCLTNELAGSDGDIFSHVWKLYGMGPLIGTRTWGGVIGISPRHLLVDRAVTTQPEFSHWFEDVRWGLENYGTAPDIEVPVTPEQSASGADPQLQRAIDEILARLDASPPSPPDLGGRPRLGRP